MSSYLHKQTPTHKQTHTHRDTPWQVQELWSYSFKSLTTKHQKKPNKAKTVPTLKGHCLGMKSVLHQMPPLPTLTAHPFASCPAYWIMHPVYLSLNWAGKVFFGRTKSLSSLQWLLSLAAGTPGGSRGKHCVFFYPSECGMDYLLFCELLSIRPTVKF